MSLAEQIVHLRQLASDDPETSLLDLAIIKVLAELAEAVEELRGPDPPRGRGRF
jgi:antitoxin component HigA of HigAB toxin-antitoxin module